MVALICVIGVILFLIFSLHFKWLEVEVSFIVGIVFLLITQVLTIQEVLEGFSNETLIVILLLVSIGEILRKSNLLEILFDFFFKGAKTYNGFLGRMILVIGSFSAFLNNTPIVALMMPYGSIWSKRNNISVSKFLIPISYIAILGGSCTLIGSSTNLMVNSLISEYSSEIPLLGLFDFAFIGVTMLVLGGGYLLILAYKLLPSKVESSTLISKNIPEYLIEARVTEQSAFIDKTITKAGLRNLSDLYLVKIIRGTKEYTSVPPTFILKVNDTVVFAGDTGKIASLVKNKNLELYPDTSDSFKNSELVELVVSHNSYLADHTVKESRFRSEFDAAIIAIRRGNKKIEGKIGSIKIKPGDVLLVLSGEDFENRAIHTSDFYVISKKWNLSVLNPFASKFILIGTLVSILLSAFGLVSLFTSLLVLFTLIIGFKLVDKKEVYHSIDLKLGIIIALALALGKAMKKSGLSDEIANMLYETSKNFGDTGLYVVIFVVTSFLAAYVTGKAAIAIMIPVGISLAGVTSLDYLPIILTIAFAASANFMTPHGYQTNLMVFQSGDYSYRDFMKIGFPLTLLYMVVTIFCITYFY